MLPFVNTLLQGAASVRSLLSPTSPKSPTTTFGNIAAADADSNTPTPSQQQLPAIPDGERAGTDADTTTPSTLSTPEERRDREDADADSDTTVVGEEAEMASEKRRRKRREKVARQRNRQSGPGPGPGPLGGTPESSEPQAGPASPAPPAPPATGDGAEDEGDSPRGRATARSEDVAGVEGGLRVDSRIVEDDAEAGGDQVQILKADEDDKTPRVTVKEVGQEEDQEEDSQDRGDATHSEPQLVDSTASDDGAELDEHPPSYPTLQLIDSTSNDEQKRTLSHPEPKSIDLRSTIESKQDERTPSYTEPQRVDATSTIESEHDQRAPSYSEPQRVGPISAEETERTEREPVLPEPQPVDATSNSEPERDERDPAGPEPPRVNLTTSIFALVRTEKDPRCSKRRLATLRTNRPPPPHTIPTIKQLYPKHGLGPTIQIPSEQSHPLLIDTLDSLHTTPKPKPALNQPCPTFPESLSKFQDIDLADPLRAAYMSATAHSVLADRLWRTVRFANYFLPDRAPPGIALPQKFESSQRKAVENAVSEFLRRTMNDGSEERRVMNRLTQANRTMASLLHSYLMLEMKMSRGDLFHMYVQSYGRGGEEGVDCKVDIVELGALFDGGGRRVSGNTSFD